MFGWMKKGGKVNVKIEILKRKNKLKNLKQNVLR